LHAEVRYSTQAWLSAAGVIPRSRDIPARGGQDVAGLFQSTKDEIFRVIYGILFSSLKMRLTATPSFLTKYSKGGTLFNATSGFTFP
jgi:hypothetical protein